MLCGWEVSGGERDMRKIVVVVCRGINGSGLEVFPGILYLVGYLGLDYLD